MFAKVVSIPQQILTPIIVIFCFAGAYSVNSSYFDLSVALVSFRHGVKWGLFTGLVNGCLQMLLGFWAPPTPTFLYFLGEVLLDYLIAFMALGTAELFARPFKNRMVGVAFGTFMAGVLRFLCSFLSGVLVWGNLNEGLSAWTYSLVYNASYMLPETLLTVVAAVLLARAPFRMTRACPRLTT